MKIPTKDRGWIREIETALIKAEEKTEKNGDDFSFLYRLAPDIVVRKRKIKDGTVINRVKELGEIRVQEDWEIDEESKKQYLFHFVSCYIFCHVDFGLISEIEGDRLMDVFTDSVDIFL